MKMYSCVARSPRLFAVSQKFAALGTHLVSPFSNYVRLPAFTGWGYSKDLPRFAGKTFHKRWSQVELNIGTQVDRYTGKEISYPPLDSDDKAEPMSLTSQFIQELTKVNGNVIRTTPEELNNQLISFLKARQINQIHLEPHILDEIAFANAGITISHTSDPALRVGVTKAICGLADTGSILIADGEGNPLQASLLPELHVAILCAPNILPSLANALTMPIVRTSKSVVVITGPSRTADIEMSLTIGMHGPGEVHVFLVDD
jgi:L-lactate dehydrogenase complex protein LldG